VENGAVLAELSRTPCWRPDTRQALAQALGRPLALPEASSDADLPDLAVSFERSHRFDAASGIGRLAALLRAGAADAAVALLAEGAADLAWRPTASAAALDALLDEGPVRLRPGAVPPVAAAG
jgi:exodeoxyribonuclease V alpha subunit